MKWKKLVLIITANLIVATKLHLIIFRLRIRRGSWVTLCFHNPSKAYYEALLNVFMKAGWEFLPLSDVLNMNEVSSNIAVVTFDDGWADILDVISSDGVDVPTTVFLVTSEMGEFGNSISILGSKYCKGVANSSRRLLLSKDEVLLLSKNSNVDFQLHTHSHKDLVISDEKAIENDLKTNIYYIYSILNISPYMIAYPYGKVPDDFVVRMLKNQGVKYGFALRNRTSSLKEPYNIARIGVDESNFNISVLKLIKRIYL
jgi:peptidoglycan/xylan/chitin deacetylase (PgdA/CDA1 family)